MDNKLHLNLPGQATRSLSALFNNIQAPTNNNVSHHLLKLTNNSINLNKEKTR